MEFSGVRNSWLMLRQKARFQLAGLTQVLGVFLQLGVERHHAAIGVAQFAG